MQMPQQHNRPNNNTKTQTEAAASAAVLVVLLWLECCLTILPHCAEQCETGKWETEKGKIFAEFRLQSRANVTKLPR